MSLDSALELLSFTPEVIEPIIQIGMGDAETIVKTTNVLPSPARHSTSKMTG